ncbi:MAG TPA: NAD(P)-dependent alcohol dehydrogenase, partial [Kofleriaceae bacterium]|nr:NAD(P)-dependent alcohol dehydrogenase [Kofleriaceae bacterium]
RPKFTVPGSAMAGRVEAVGANVTMFRIGDEVFGETVNGAFAEYVVVAAAEIALKPTNLSFEEAAAAPWAVTALQALRDAGRLQAGQRVLINGASGGVGTWAVQIAKALGAHVTAVCSTRNVEMVRSIGADEIIDYTKQDFVDGGARYDLVFDTVSNRTLAAYRSVLLPTGTYVTIGGGNSSWRWLLRLARLSILSRFTQQRLVSFIVAPNREDLLRVKELVEARKARPVIASRYALDEVAEALRQVGEGHASGQTIIRIAR